MKTPLVWTAALTVAACVAACSPAADTRASAPAPSNPSSASTTTSPAPATGAGPAVALSALKPCDLLTDAQRSLYGYTGSTFFDDGTTRTCTYSQQGSARQLVISFSDTSIRTLNHDQGDTVTSQAIGKHPAVRVQSGDSPMCSYFLDIEGTQLATIQAIGQASSDQACTHGLSVAALVEPSLP